MSYMPYIRLKQWKGSNLFLRVPSTYYIYDSRHEVVLDLY
jgi:hypothetical protein